jgi:DNA-binding response OmpR family regulator
MLPSLLPESVSDYATASGGARPSAWPTLLVMDTDQEMTRTLVCFFEKRGFHVAAGTSLAEVKLFFHRCKIWTLVISDYHLADCTGLDVCDWIREQGSDAPVLLLSGSPHSATLCAGNEYLAKPFRLETLEAYVRTVQRRSS